MTTPSVQTLLTYANVQMAAETIYPDNFTPGPIDPAWLMEGNNRSSRFPAALAAQFVGDWTVESHEPNTTTGFSGTLFKNRHTNELVLSFRSTEFIDDALRDNQATNALEIKELGWAFGQIADMENWWASLQGQLGTTVQVTVTGYSLGGHLATAFQELHPERVRAAYTFNGAGVGRVNAGASLASVIAAFNTDRNAATDWSAAFTSAAAKSLYQSLRLTLSAGGLLTSDHKALVVSLLPEGTNTDPKGWPKSIEDPDIKLLVQALKRIEVIQQERERIRLYTSGSAASPDPADVPPVNVAATDLNYQLAALIAARSTGAFSLGNGFWNTFFNDRNLLDPLVPGFVDVRGSTFYSAVANSQRHYGVTTDVFIEDQPLYRGTVLWDAYRASKTAGEPKLLVDGFANNDFGDTHSLVLLVDSLAVQQAYGKLDPTLTLARAQALLEAMSNARASQADGTQGKADGNTLEYAVDLLNRLLIGPGATRVGGGSLDGNTWHRMDDRNALHAGLGDIVAGDRFKSLEGRVTILPSNKGLAERAGLDFGALVSLLAFSPVEFRAKDAASQAAVTDALKLGWSSALSAWTTDRALSAMQRSAGLATYSIQWLSDRELAIEALVARNTENQAQGAGVKIVGRGDARVDIRFANPANEQVEQIPVVGRHALVVNPQAPLLAFGAEQADVLTGTNHREGDHMYGEAGNDLLRGLAGPDHLEGNTGADTLIGGAGADTLFGGTGSDVYLFTTADLAERVTDLIGDADGQGQIRIATGLNPDGTPIGDKPLALTGWSAVPDNRPNAPKRYTNQAGFTLTVVGKDVWTLSGGGLPTEASLRLSSDKTLSLSFGRAGATLEIKDWSEGKLGIQLQAYTAPTTPAPQQGLAQMRDLAMLQVAAGIDLLGAIGAGQAGLIARLTAAPGGSGTADRLTPAQAQDLLSRYEVLVQVGNDGSGFSATVFRRKPALDAQGQPIPEVDPYVVAFRGNDHEPHRAGGLAKDGGLGAMMEINREGFAYGQLDAMQRFWAGLAQGKVMNRAGQMIDVGAASGAASSRNLVIGSGVGAHLAAAFALLHPGNVAQAIGFDGPGLGGVSDGAGGSRAITAGELQAKLDRFVLMMANRSPSNSFTEEIAQAGGAWMQKYLLALEADRPNEVQFSGYYNVLSSAGLSPLGPGSDTYQAAQGYENFWDGANIYQSQFYQFIVDWLSRDTVGASQAQQLDAAWAALTAPDNRDAASGQFNTGAFNYPAKNLDGQAAGTYTSWTLDPDRLDPSALVGGQGYGGQQRSLWVEDTLGIATPASRSELDQQIYDRGWGLNTASRPVGSPGNLTRLLDSLELASLFQAIDPRVGADTYANLQRATSRARETTQNPRLPVGTAAWAASVEARDGDTLERSVNALSRLLLGVDPQLQAAAGPAGVMNAGARAAWSAQFTLLNNKLAQLKTQGAQLTVLDLTQFTADQIAGLAEGDNAQGIAVRWALAQGQPWAIADEAGKLYQGVTDPRILQKPEHSGAAYTHQWIDDRAAWLVGMIGARTRNLGAAELKELPDDKNTTGGWEQQRWSFSDAQEGISFTFKPAGSDAAVLGQRPESFTRFGRDDDAKSDDLTGGDSRDWLYGQRGADVLKGRAGNDLIEGGSGADQVYAGADNDIVIGGPGNDTLYGEAGDDKYEFNRDRGTGSTRVCKATIEQRLRSEARRHAVALC